MGWLEAPVFPFRTSPTLGDLALALVPCAAIASTGFGALGLHDPFAPLVAQEPGQTRLLVARALVLLIAVARIPARERAGALVLALAGALFVLSVALRGLAVVDLVATPALVVWLTRRTSRHEVVSRAPSWLGPILVTAACAVGVVRVRAEVPPAPPNTPRDAVEYWRARGNLYRAHAAALSLASGEATPGDGYVVLASLDWELGHDERARRVIAMVLERTTSESARRKAEELARRWNP
jgi:hypothetical protein